MKTDVHVSDKPFQVNRCKVTTWRHHGALGWEVLSLSVPFTDLVFSWELPWYILQDVFVSVWLYLSFLPWVLTFWSIWVWNDQLYQNHCLYFGNVIDICFLTTKLNSVFHFLFEAHELNLIAVLMLCIMRGYYGFHRLLWPDFDVDPVWNAGVMTACFRYHSEPKLISTNSFIEYLQ